MTLLALNALRTGEVLSRDIDDLTYDFGHLVLELACKGGKRSTEALAPATARALEVLHRQAHERVDLPRPQGRPHDRADAWPWCGASPAEPASPPPIG